MKLLKRILCFFSIHPSTNLIILEGTVKKSNKPHTTQDVVVISCGVCNKPLEFIC